MSDLEQTIRDDRNAVERLGQAVPGFRGYFDRENRREADKLLRDFGVTRLERMVSDLHEATKRAPLEQMDEFGEVVNRVEKLRNELRNADRGYSGFFDEVKWDTDEALDAVYAQDERLVDQLVLLSEQVASGDFALDPLREQLRTLERAHADRRLAILGLTQG
jgi:hypothetical protein